MTSPPRDHLAQIRPIVVAEPIQFPAREANTLRGQLC